MVANKRNPLAESHMEAEVGARRRGVAAEELRRHNLTAVLARLHIAGPLTRSQLAHQTGLNRSTIRDLIGELARLDLVDEDRGTTSNGPGRPSSVARANSAGAVVLAAEFEVDSLAVATIGLGGHIFDQVRIPNTGPASPASMVEELGHLARPLLASLPSTHTLAGVGVAVAGVVRRSDGFLNVAPNLGWRDVSLGSLVAAELDIGRVVLANEADVGALAEFRRGAARDHRHLICIAGEVGVGVGIIHDGKPMLGVAGYAGEAGHMMINPAGRKCRCGSVGCWETEVGEEALARRVGLPPDAVRQGLVDEVTRLAHAGDTKTFTGLDELGWWLGAGIGNLINVCNPDLVVIGGFYHQLYPFLESSVRRGAQDVALDAPWAACDLRRSELGPDAVLIGAAELVLTEVINDPTGFNSAREPVVLPSATPQGSPVVHASDVAAAP